MGFVAMGTVGYIVKLSTSALPPSLATLHD